jgi:hypothetical protein
MMMKNIFSKNSNAFFRFAVAARTDNLPTPANIKREYNTEGERCRRCGGEGVPTLAHILNKCRPEMVKMTERHNALSGVIKRAVMEELGDQITNGIFDNVTVQIEGLSDEVSRQKPDLWFISDTNGTRRMELIEFTCPYGYISQPDERGNRVNSLEQAYKKKHAKYALLAEEIQERANLEVRVTVIVVSSLGAVYRESLKELGKMLRCSKTTLRKLAKRMSETVITGSMKLWREYAKTMEHIHESAEAEARIENEIQILEREHREEEREEGQQIETMMIEGEIEMEAEEEIMEQEGESAERDIVDQVMEMVQLEAF